LKNNVDTESTEICNIAQHSISGYRMRLLSDDKYQTHTSYEIQHFDLEMKNLQWMM